MTKHLVYIAYGWLTFTGVVHFAIDVISQHVRGKRTPSPETTLYYGLHSAFALGQVLFGSLVLWLAWRNREIATATPVIALSLVAAAGWLAITVRFMEYWEPKFNVTVFAALVVLTALFGRR